MKVRFRPRPVPTLCTIVLVPILVGLGLWQTDRAEQRTATLELYTTRIDSPPITIGAALESPEEIEYRQVRTGGTWDQSREFFLDNQVSSRRAGYHVITPLLLQGGTTAVLVNRGWIPAAADRSIVPHTQPLTGTADVVGVAVIPAQDAFTLEDDGPLDEHSSPVWQVLDFQRFEDAAPYSLQGFVIQLDPAMTGGFERDWKPPSDEWVFRHKAYAFQWFTLCAALLVIYFLFAFRPHKES
ncbi:MAG: SURF1 family protein [Acidiferrobacterales bacterium]|nr:SURF1 family protein [Acidiferrobacterales bacterium]